MKCSTCEFCIGGGARGYPLPQCNTAHPICCARPCKPPPTPTRTRHYPSQVLTCLARTPRIVRVHRIASQLYESSRNTLPPRPSAAPGVFFSEKLVFPRRVTYTYANFASEDPLRGGLMVLQTQRYSLGTNPQHSIMSRLCSDAYQTGRRCGYHSLPAQGVHLRGRHREGASFVANAILKDMDLLEPGERAEAAAGQKHEARFLDPRDGLRPPPPDRKPEEVSVPLPPRIPHS